MTDVDPLGNPEERIVPMRLQKFLARAGAASRRGSENLMTAGRVTVNGSVVCELGSKVDPLIDIVAVDGIVVRISDEPVTLMLNKPAGYLTTMSDPFDRPCVASLIPLASHPGLFPIGRLDNDTTGLLLFSTDGELGNRLLHPRHHVEKTYDVEIEEPLDAAEIAALEQGIELEDGRTLPAKVAVLDNPAHGDSAAASVRPESGVNAFAQITIREGRKRQVRRMFEAIGHPVIGLHRSSFGPLFLGDLAEGQWRMLDEEELQALYAACR